MKRIAYLTLSLLLSMYCLLLFVRGDLDSYINTRYIGLTFIAGLAGVFFSVVGLITRRAKIVEILSSNEYRKLIIGIAVLCTLLLLQLYFVALFVFVILLVTTTIAPTMFSHKEDLLVVLVLLLGFLFPVVPLQSITAQTRVDTLNSFQSTQFDGDTNSIQFIFDTKGFSISEWISTINTNPDLEKFVGKEVDITGFIFNPVDVEDGYFLVGRFVVRCCAVDATPAGLFVKADLDGFMTDDWVQVKGVFDIGEINGVTQLFITNVQMQSIDRPNEPYIYI